MAVSLLSNEVSDLCLGKPPLRSLSVRATMADALAALKTSEESFISIWSCIHDKTESSVIDTYGDDECECECECECLGKICMADVICYLCQDEKNLLSPSTAFKASVSALLPKIRDQVVHVEPSCSLLEAIDLIIQGAQNLVVPIRTKPIPKRRQQKLQSQNSCVSPTPTHKNGRQYCWLTQEDIIRFLLGSIGLFSPLPALSIADLGIISLTHAVLAVDYYSAASAAVAAICTALTEQTSVAVVDGGVEGDAPMVMIGEISPSTLACCDETAAAAVATLSAGDLMAYIDCGGPPEGLARVVQTRLEDKGLVGMLLYLDSFSSSSSSSSSCSSSSYSSSDEESTAVPARSYGRSVSYSARMVRRSEAIVCNPKSSLMAVMIQAIAHRVNYVWVIEKDCSMVGIVTFVDMLKVFREHLENTE